MRCKALLSLPLFSSPRPPFSLSSPPLRVQLLAQLSPSTLSPSTPTPFSASCAPSRDVAVVCRRRERRSRPRASWPVPSHDAVGRGRPGAVCRVPRGGGAAFLPRRVPLPRRARPRRLVSSRSRYGGEEAHASDERQSDGQWAAITHATRRSARRDRPAHRSLLLIPLGRPEERAQQAGAQTG
jgi:hypothetical protein